MEIALFFRATIRVSEVVAGFPYVPNVDRSIYAVLRRRVSQRVLRGEKVSSATDDYYNGKLTWDLDFPWGTNFYDKAGKQANTLLLNLTKCDFQLQ